MERLIGKKAPAFTMNAVTGDGETLYPVHLEDYRGKWLALFFYPLDFTFVCPTEITGFSENYEQFKQCGAEILGVSADSEYCHQAWVRDGLGKIKFPLASDKTLSVASDYGVLLEDEGIALRGLFLIDEEQIIRYSVIHDLNVGRSTQETLRVLKALQTKGLCGANWSVGESPLNDPILQESFQPSQSSSVKVYSMPGCSYCKNVKAYLTEHNIAFEEIDLETNKIGQAFMDSRGYTALPVTVIGDKEISGYRLEEIKKALS